ncbi:unnamed protein product [Prunus armeniaca]
MSRGRSDEDTVKLKVQYNKERTTKSKRELNIILPFGWENAQWTLYVYGFHSKGLGAISSGLHLLRNFVQLGMEDGDEIDALEHVDGA